jgi:YHS domain-containing protein
LYGKEKNIDKNCTSLTYLWCLHFLILNKPYWIANIKFLVSKSKKIDKPHPLLHHGDMRYLIIFALLYLCYYVVKKAILPAIRTYKVFRKYRESPPAKEDKEMVQDPHCHTYIPKETALSATIGGEVYYFCSQDCLDEYTRST